MKKLYIYSSIIIIFVTGVLVYLYQAYFGLSEGAFESALNSFIVSLVILVVTVIVINFLFSHHHERINKEKERNEYIKVLNEAHEGLVFQLKTYIITFITKEMAKTSADKNDKLIHVIELSDLKSQLDHYITSDFVKKEIEVTQPGKFDLFDFQTINLKHTEWLMQNNNIMLSKIHKYLMLYSGLMPRNIIKLLVEIELIITRESIFLVPDFKSFQDHMNNSLLDDESIEKVKDNLLKIIDKIIELENYMDTK